MRARHGGKRPQNNNRQLIAQTGRLSHSHSAARTSHGKTLVGSGGAALPSSLEKNMTCLRLVLIIFVISLMFSPLAHSASAIFAGGCYWCMEEIFDHTQGVSLAISGFSAVPPKSDRVEAVQLTFDPAKISYEDLLKLYWKNIDPTDGGGQFCDRGQQYRSVIFYRDEQQKALAEKTKQEAETRLKRAVATEIVPVVGFYPAVESQQDYWKKDPVRYKQYRMHCGRDRRLRELWGESE